MTTQVVGKNHILFLSAEMTALMLRIRREKSTFTVIASTSEVAQKGDGTEVSLPIKSFTSHIVAQQSRALGFTTNANSFCNRYPHRLASGPENGALL